MSRMSRANGHTRHEILSFIKCHGAMTAEELGKELSISQVAVRQHLASLEAEDIVSVSVERHGLGRPAHRYHLTAAGDETFPRCYDKLAETLLDELAKWQGEAAVASLLDRRHEQTRALLEGQFRDKPLLAKVQELARFQSSQGFMAEAVEDDHGTLRLVKHNCAICAVARNHPNACCAGEQPFLQELLGNVHVVQETRILGGDHTCTFVIRDCNKPAEQE